MDKFGLSITVTIEGCDPYHARFIPLVPNFGIPQEQKLVGKEQTLHALSPTVHRSFPIMAGFSMTDSQFVDCKLTATDKRGNPTTLPTGSVNATSDNAAVLTASVNADGSVRFTAAGTLGTANGSVSITDPTGNVLAAGSIAFTIVSGAPTSIAIAPGTPQEQP